MRRQSIDPFNSGLERHSHSRRRYRHCAARLSASSVPCALTAINRRDEPALAL